MSKEKEKQDNLPATTGQMLPGATGQSSMPEDIESEAGESYNSLRLMAPLSAPVVAEKIAAGKWAVVSGDEVIVNLGKNPTVIPIAYTMKALDVRDENNVRVSHDANSDLFKAIKADVPLDSQNIFSGVEYLMYIDGCGFAPYYCASKSAKIGVQTILGSGINRVMTLDTKLVKSKGNTFWVPAVLPTSPTINLPGVEDLERAIEKWRNGLKSSEERAAGTTGSEAR